MPDLDIAKALEAGADSGFDRGNDSRHEIAARILTAALPHILDALAEEALAGVDRKDWVSLTNIAVAKWLRAKADEVRQ